METEEVNEVGWGGLVDQEEVVGPIPGVDLLKPTEEVEGGDSTDVEEGSKGVEGPSRDVGEDDGGVVHQFVILDRY